MERKYSLNYDALDNYIKEQQKNTIGRTDGELTMLRNNCKNYIEKNLNNPNEFIISINEDTGDVNINGQEGLEDKFYMLPTGYEMSKKARLYRHVKLSIEEAERRGVFDKIFKEIKEELNGLKESITNGN